MDFICLLLINLLSIVLLFCLFFTWKISRKQFVKPIIFDLVAYFVLLKILLCFLLPSILRITSNWKYDRIIGATPSEIATVYTIEFISYLVWMLSILIVTQMSWFKKMSKRINSPYRRGVFVNKKGHLALTIYNAEGNLQKKEKFIGEHEKIFLFVLCGFYLLFLPFIFDKNIRPPEILSLFIEPTVMMAGPVVALYIFSLGRKYIGNLIFAFGFVLTLISLIWGFASGVRGQLVGMAEWLFFLFFFVNRKKSIIFVSIIGIVAIILFQSSMLEVRGLPGYYSKTPIERIQSIIYENKTQRIQNNLLDSIEFRFGEASRLSVAFLRLYENGKAAGLETIKSALYAPLPRKFFKDKPQPGSIDGTKEGMGMYIIQAVMRNAPWNMSDFFTGLHAYWELGIVGVILYSFLSGVFIIYCANYFARFGLVGLPMMMVMLKPWWNEPKLWISEIILQVVHILIPLLLIWYIVKFILGIRRILKKSLKKSNF